jgi:hypothetical protein
MKDLLTNIKKAIEIINRTKNLTIQLTDPDLKITDEVPVGISKAEWEECLKEMVRRDILFTADDLAYNFDCRFNFADLLIPESDAEAYTEAMKRIIKAIYDQYKYFKNLGCGSSVNLNTQQTITGTNTYPSWSTLSQSAFSNLNVAGGLDVNGEINADDIKVNGGQLSVSSELDDLKKRNDALKAELDLLKAILTSKGVM